MHFHSISDAYLPMISCRFLLVSLNIDAILGEVTIRQRRKKLEEMTLGGGLSDAYAATLTRLKAQKGYKSVLGLKVLMWVMYSERPLQAHELCHALGVELGSADLDLENVPALRTLVSSCLGLVTVEVSSSTVRLVHFTLQEHLSRDPTLFHNPHSAIAEVCLTYLNFGYIKDLSPAHDLVPAETPLLEYASIYWGRHTRKGTTESLKMLSLRLLDRFDEHISTRLLLLHHDREGDDGLYFYRSWRSTRFTGLHGVAFLGIAGIVPAVLEMKEWDVNAYDCMGMTALTWAAARGHEEVVTMVLRREDVNPDQADTLYGQTPLSWAAKKGHLGIIKILLEQEGVNPDKADTFNGQTPLSWAAEKGHEGIVKMLSQRRDVCAATPDSTNQTPQPLALSEEHDTIVSIQQERGNVNCVAADRGSPTSLPPSSLTRDECVVGMQLQSHDSNTDMTDFNFQPEPLPAAHHQLPRLLHLGDSIPGPADGGPSAQPPRWPRSLFIWPSELRYPPRKTDAHSNTQPIFSFAVDRSFIIASLVCLFAFLLYIFLSSSLDIFSFRKYLPGEGLV